MSLVNKRELAEIVGFSERTLTEWQGEGLPVEVYADQRGQANEYKTEDVIQWMIRREIMRLKAEKPRDRLDRLKADQVELDIAERVGQLAPASMFERAWQDHILAARVELLTMPDVLASELSAHLGQNVDSELIRIRVEEALEKLSRYGIDGDEGMGDVTESGYAGDDGGYG